MAKKHNFIGKTVKWVGSKDGYPASNLNVKVGTEFVVKSRGGSCGGSYYTFNLHKDGHNFGWAYEHELQLVSMNVEQLEEEIKNKEAEIKEANEEIRCLQGKIDFIKKFGLENYDEDEFKAYSVLETLGLGDIEKAKAIVKILQK